MVGTFNDGVSSKSHITKIALGVSGIKLVDLDIIWEFKDIRIVQNPSQGLPGVITNFLNPDQRVVIEDGELFARIKANLSPSRARFIYFKKFVRDNRKLLSLLLIAIIALPFSLKFLSSQIDDEFMKKIGDDLVERLVTKKNQCVNPKGQESLEKLVGEISQDQYQIYIVKKDIINAIALPGGSIIIYSKLLDKFKHPNELAFILGHEMGHIKQEHHKYHFIVGNFLSRIGGVLSFLTQKR